MSYYTAPAVGMHLQPRYKEVSRIPILQILKWSLRENKF